MAELMDDTKLVFCKRVIQQVSRIDLAERTADLDYAIMMLNAVLLEAQSHEVPFRPIDPERLEGFKKDLLSDRKIRSFTAFHEIITYCGVPKEIFDIPADT